VAPWGFIETDARLSLWLPDADISPRAAQLADWLKATLNR
jgi:hypothetical protein